MPADYDGDGKADLAVYRTDDGLWYGLTSTTGYTPSLNIAWGGGDRQAPVKGDYDGDGRADLAIYNALHGQWYVLFSGANYSTSLTRTLGGPTYVALPRYP